MKSVKKVLESEQEKEMRRIFLDQSSQISEDRRNYQKPGNKIGLELECHIAEKETLDLAPESVRNSLTTNHGNTFGKELGASQLEIRTEPMITDKDVFEILYEDLKSSQKLARSLIGNDYTILNMGFHPLAEFNPAKRTSTEEKYKLVPDFHNEYESELVRKFFQHGVDLGDAGIMGLANSVQCNIEAKSLGDAVDKQNRSFHISPYIWALASNAKFVGGRDIGFEDIRMKAWEVSHDTRDLEEVLSETPIRVGLPKDYDNSIEDYFRRVAEHPFILSDKDHAFEIGIGLNWNDTRIKFNRNSKTSIVEFRPISTQPSTQENIALMAFYVGRLLYSQKTGEKLLPMQLVNHNREEVMKYGLDSRLYSYEGNRIKLVEFRNIAERELRNAELGLLSEGMKKYGFNILKKRIQNGNPSNKLSRIIHSKGYNTKSVRESTKEICGI
ncbi:hypothetical protein HN865_03060 [Candidatus Woesearchaeota archaeon]|jgi:gamma-glutamyl:cysteine ligase YbdK (ATP-grasp superfamily)|nr:hypothetical protein [Candidatus Woesearchaeota archaeon]MBT7237813.1 hypothetical protein [Candidatus Woesearchaeota archaeon]